MVKKGDTVVVEYSGSLADGTTFDSSVGREPLEFKVGEGQVIPGFDAAVLGMEINEEKTVTIPSDEAYGPYREDRMIEVAKEHLPPDFAPKVGLQLQMRSADGDVMIVTIKEIKENSVTLDANSPLAGQDLTFQIRLLKINE